MRACLFSSGLMVPDFECCASFAGSFLHLNLLLIALKMGIREKECVFDDSRPWFLSVRSGCGQKKKNRIKEKQYMKKKILLVYNASI